MRTPVPSQQVINEIGYDQAVRLAGGYALGTGNLLRVVRAEREQGRWKVRVDVQSLVVTKQTYVELDATTGELLELRTSPLPDAPPNPARPEP